MPLKGALSVADHLPPGAEVSVTCSPALGIENTLDFSEELLRRGFYVVPHLSARLVRDEAHLEGILGRLSEAGVREVFVVGGDAKEPRGPYPGGLELLQAMRLLGHDFERIGVPAYPEGHPLVGEEVLTQALLAKQPFASYAVTQICFEPEPILLWLSRVRRAGLALPVYIGIPGVVDLKKLLGISLKIGIGASVGYLRKQHGWLGNLVLRGRYSPESLVRELAPHAGEGGIEGFHINTFNAVEETESWRRRTLAASGEKNAKSARETEP